jgi:alkylmercury lyase
MAIHQARAELGDRSVERLGQAIIAAMPELDEMDQRVAAGIYRLMSLGHPVERAAIADSSGIAVDQVGAKLDAWPGVFRDAKGRVVGFWGHTLAKLDPEYRLVADGRTTFAWCALDTLFIPGVIGKTVRVEASDPVSGQPVSLVVEGAGTREVNPPSALAVSDGPFGYDVIESFCHRVLFFASEETGARWIAEHPGSRLLSVGEAFEVGRILTHRIVPGIAQ